MGMVDDSSASRDSYFYDSPHRCDPEKNRYSYPIICHERYRGRRLSQSIWCTYHCSRFYNWNRKYHWCGNRYRAGWSWCCSLVLADRCFRNRHEIQRVSYRCQIPCENERRTYAGRCHVCTETRVTYEMAGIAFFILRQLRFLWNRMCY